MTPRIPTLIAMLAVVLLLTACIPERINWSPDGQQALIVTAAGLCVGDADGKISPVLIPRARQAQWLNDNRRAVVVYQDDIKTWKDYTAIRPNAERELKDKADALRKDILSHQGDWSEQDMDTFFTAAKTKLKITDNEMPHLLLYIRDIDGQAVKAKLGAQAKLLDDLPITIWIARVYDITKDAAKPGLVLLQGIEEIVGLRVSPRGTAVAIMVDASNDRTALILAPTQNADDDIRSLGEAARYPDWSADGKYLYFIKPAAVKDGGKAQFGTLVRRQVAAPNGELLPTNLPQPDEELVGLIYSSLARVRVTRDDRVFFSSVDVTLPATPRDMPDRGSVFSIEPGKQATITRIVPRGVQADIGDAVEFFEPSPDGTLVSLPFRDGRVTVLTTATGELRTVQPEKETNGANGENGTLQTVPVWRSDLELCFIRPVPQDKTREVILYNASTNETRRLSTKWPADIRNGWLTEPPPPATKPATRPADTQAGHP